MKTEVIVVAGGLGKRLKTALPKALMPLKGKSLVSYCLKVFNAHPAIDGIIVVGVKEHLKSFERIAQNFNKVCAVVAGGSKRSDSVKCGLKVLAPDTKIVLVHDAARPFVDKLMMDRLITALRKNKAATVGVPVKFTVKKVDASLNVKETPERHLLWETQTPQGFHKDILVKAHAKKSKIEATDDAVLAEHMGIKVKMIMGDYKNIKITTPDDFKLAELLQSK